MGPAGILLAVGLSIGVVAQSCDVGGFTIDDVSDTVTVTNASTSQTAMVLVSTSQASGELILEPGVSRTFHAIAATKYTVQVAAFGGDGVGDYKASLLELRNDLVELSVNPGDSNATPEAALSALLTVERALHQLESNGLQSCSHAIVSGADNHATMTWTSPGGLGGVWDLSCD